MGEDRGRKLPDVTIEAMSIRDIEEIVAIENASFPTPWSAVTFIKDMRNSHSVCYVARIEDRLIGYTVAWLVPNELHIGNIAIDASFRRRGIASVLLSKLLGLAREKRIERVTLEVRASNTRAISLYHKFGFKEVAIIRNYYGSENEDALVMLLDTGSDQSFDSPIP